MYLYLYDATLTLHCLLLILITRFGYGLVDPLVTAIICFQTFDRTTSSRATVRVSTRSFGIRARNAKIHSTSSSAMIHLTPY